MLIIAVIALAMCCKVPGVRMIRIYFMARSDLEASGFQGLRSWEICCYAGPYGKVGGLECVQYLGIPAEYFGAALLAVVAMVALLARADRKRHSRRGNDTAAGEANRDAVRADV
jgi:hypothetical protein